MPTTKTDNSFLADKVALRLAHLPDQKTVRVLDCFAGRGTIWAAVRKLAPERDIRVLPIEIQPEEDTLFSLPGDNSRFLETLDLNRFDVIDLDAYSIPYDQLKIIFKRGFRGVVYVTFIQAVFGIMPNGLLRELGFPPVMVKLSPSLFTKKGFEYFLSYLAMQGVTRVWIRQNQGKHYLGFMTTAEGNAGGWFSGAGAPAGDSGTPPEDKAKDRV